MYLELHHRWEGFCFSDQSHYSCHFGGWSCLREAEVIQVVLNFRNLVFYGPRAKLGTTRFYIESLWENGKMPIFCFLLDTFDSNSHIWHCFIAAKPIPCVWRGSISIKGQKGAPYGEICINLEKSSWLLRVFPWQKFCRLRGTFFILGDTTWIWSVVVFYDLMLTW